MNDDQRALRDAFLAELWPVCREVPRDVRAAKRQMNRDQQRQAEEREAIRTAFPQESTGCAETGDWERPEGCSECA